MTPAPRLGLLTAIRLAANGAFRFLYPFLPVVARDLGVPQARAGLLVSAVALGGVAAPIVRRWLTGGHERARHLLVTSAALMAVGALVAAGAPGLVIAVVGFGILGIGKPLLDVATIAYVADRVPYARRARATGVMELTWAGALILIAPVAGVIAGATRWQVPFVGLGFAVALLAVAAHRVLDPDARPAVGDLPARIPLAPGARGFLLVVALVFAALEATFSVFGLWLEDVFDARIEQLGALAAVSSLGELAGSTAVLFAADRIGKARATRIGLAVCAVGFATLPFAGSLPLAIAGLALGLLGSETAIVATIPMASEVQPQARSRFLALMVGTAGLTRAVIGGIGPAVYAAVGIVGNVAMSIVVAAAAAVALRAAVRRSPHL